MKMKIDGIELYYEVHGKGDPIIFSHAFMDDCSVWKSQTDFFAQKYTVILYDQRGHGKSDKPKGSYAIQTMANDLYLLIQKLNLNKVTLVGNSLGGMAAIMVTLDHPDKVSKLVLVCSSARVSILNRLLAHSIPIIRYIVPYSAFARITQKAKVYQPSEQVIKQALDRSRHMTKYAACELFKEFGNYDVRGRISQIEMPTLIVAGEKDWQVPMKLNQFTNVEIKGSKLRIIPNCAHVPSIEKPGEFNQILAEFLG